MTRLDDRLVPAAKRILDKFGKDTVMTVVGTQVYDPTTRATTDSSVTTVTVKATPPFSLNRGSDAHRNYVENDLIEEGDVAIIVAKQGLTITPAKDTKVVIDGVTWRVVGITDFYSGEQIAAIQLHLRQ